MPNHDRNKEMAAAFRTPDMRQVVVRRMESSALLLTEVMGGADHGLTGPLPADEAFLVQLRLRDCFGCSYFANGRHVDGIDYRAGQVQIHDVRCDPRVELRDPFHAMHFYLPLQAINALADELALPRVSELRIKPSQTFEDDTARNLLLSCLPLLASPSCAGLLVLEHISMALTTHVASAYAGIDEYRHITGNGLARWQERRVKEIMQENLSTNLSLSFLASECGLSVQQFSRAFQQSFGMAPYRYLTTLRVTRAKELLVQSSMTLAEIAVDCGFTEQSHLNRVFKAVTGHSPGLWRRSSRHVQ